MSLTPQCAGVEPLAAPRADDVDNYGAEEDEHHAHQDPHRRLVGRAIAGTDDCKDTAEGR